MKMRLRCYHTSFLGAVRLTLLISIMKWISSGRRIILYKARLFDKKIRTTVSILIVSK